MFCYSAVTVLEQPSGWCHSVGLGLRLASYAWLEAVVLVGWLLTVNFCRPSHEFTFRVGMNFISYTLVLPPWYNKFVRACRFWSLMFMQEFGVESKTSG
jgi:hypothetical protein